MLAKNSADGSGGAIFDKGDYNHGYSDYIVNSTFSNNTAVFRGGGLYGFYSLGTRQNSTISGNHNDRHSTDANGGGGVARGRRHLYQGLHRRPTARSRKIRGGLRASAAAGAPTKLLANTIVADNSAGSSDPDTRGAFDSEFSLIENPAARRSTPPSAGSNLTWRWTRSSGGSPLTAGPLQPRSRP